MNKHVLRASTWRPVVLLAAATILAAAGAGLAQNRKSDRAERFGKALEVGQTAPDFELAILTFKNNEKNERVGVITDKKVKLSSFRGRKAVVLWFSSYT